ncbi:MAG: hypothetical protein WCA20_01005 [Candidatus Sulfotelmatobacter sp.]
MQEGKAILIPYRGKPDPMPELSNDYSYFIWLVGIECAEFEQEKGMNLRSPPRVTVTSGGDSRLLESSPLPCSGVGILFNSTAFNPVTSVTIAITKGQQFFVAP